MLVIGATGATPRPHRMRRRDVRSCAKTVGNDPNIHLGDIGLKMKHMYVCALACYPAVQHMTPPTYPPLALLLARCCYFHSGLKTALCGRRTPTRTPQWKAAVCGSVKHAFANVSREAPQHSQPASQSAIQVHPPSLSFDSSPFSGRALHLTGRRVRRLLTVNQ